MRLGWIAAIAAGWLLGAALPAAVAAPPVAVVETRPPAVNQCRAHCAAAWVSHMSCPSGALAARCKQKANTAYDQCLAACVPPPPAPPAPKLAEEPRPAPPPARVEVESTRAAPWVDAGLQWTALPARTPATLPYTFTMPRTAYDYAAITDALRPFLVKAPGVLRVTFKVVQGRAGLSLAAPDGSSLVSKEQGFDASPQPQTATFDIGPGSPPVALLVRNYDDKGAAGSVTVLKAEFARRSALPAP